MTTRVDAVILALVAQWQALAVPAGTLDGVRVVDGPQVTMDPSPEWLFVAFDGGNKNDSTESATAEQTLMGFAKAKQESGQIRNAAVVVRGDPDVPGARLRALAIVSAAETALRNDMTIGGLVMHSYVSDVSYTPLQTDDGAKVRVVFTVTYQAQF